MTLSRPLRLLPLVLALAACQTTAPREGAPVATGPAANDNLNAVAWVQGSLEYRLVAGQTWRQALLQLDRALKNPAWDALAPADRGNPATGLPPAVIVDVDETMLDNSPYQAALVRDGAVYDDASWDAWVQQRRAKPVPGALEFARIAAAQGVTIFYVSNRTDAQGPATVDNLRALGFPIPDPAQYLGMGYQVEDCVDPKPSDKGCRRRHVGRSHRVLLQIGDQIGDMVSITDNSLSGREQAVAPFAPWIGERWFVLPGPTYGSWESALYDNDRSLDEAGRRQRKLDHLRY
ncbi:5'-nucleotidase, lipoprotein e(P4) family [Arenimonas composti]|uniref:Acid phosphatase n=1 Tax=Arenimonas composti TR7-09 = DSM 18010 TaxID=1121013 RepID=A0A091BFH3_9GAMM|nr:HAD family acid phosphatase [Arenimonas composti]KFN49559.1 hypothetical protein P873_10420 [Arenimonas composti TR7-09 = DSM 18010]